jgi:hypothetical protein
VAKNIATFFFIENGAVSYTLKVNQNIKGDKYPKGKDYLKN